MNCWLPVMNLRKSRAFTLLEVLVALAIVAILVAVVYPSYTSYVERSRNNQAIADIMNISIRAERYFTVNSSFPNELADIQAAGMMDPWGRPYAYLRLATASRGKSRKDRNLVPINTDFDLYSLGPDGRSVAPLTAKHSRDDIVRAGNGSFVGVAEDY